jgi:NAD(P)-dependent dehydrogenase (short-subunit alcohol dehydrogenase family)
MSISQIQDPEPADPRPPAPKPPFPQEKIPYPGLTGQMNPRADHGEQSYKGFGRLKNRVALITGGDSGIGRAVAIAFAREGAKIALSYLPAEEQDAGETADWIEQSGSESVKLPGDLCSESYCQGVVTRTVETFGQIDLLINVAGFQVTHETIEEITTEEFDRIFKTNVYALFWLSKAALKQMKPGSGIINTASIQAFDPSPNLLAYAATKAAIVNFTKGMAPLAMKHGVRVNAVAPGPVWTPLIPATMPAKKVTEFGKDTLFERPAQPVEIAPIYVFLASNEARFVTGEVYGVTGGQTPF